MKVDRARFLFLTSTIGAATALAMAGGAGCTIVQKASDDGGTPLYAKDGGETSDPSASSDAGAKPTKPDGQQDSGSSAPASCLASGDAGALDCDALAANACDPYCWAYAENYKPEIAKAIADCLVKLPTCEGAMDAMKACVDGALAKACDDPTAKTFCTPVTTECAKNNAGADGLTEAACEGVAKGLTEAGRSNFLSCIDEGTPGTCTFASAGCVDYVK